MKQFFKINIFHVKTNRYVILYSLIYIYLVITPLLLSLNLETETGLWLCCDHLQKLLLILCVFMMIQLFKPYIELEYKDIIISINKSFKYLYVLFDYIFIQILLFPLYCLLIYKNILLLEFLCYFIFQIFIIFTVTYLVSLICSSSLLTLGIVSIYILLYSFPLADVSFANMMLKNPFPDTQYIFYGFLICVFSITLSYSIEKIIYKFFL